ncbi:unnamed protein product [Effrenium voratum]|nr:unnamed protein product [Effrenium voratum]
MKLGQLLTTGAFSGTTGGTGEPRSPSEAVKPEDPEVPSPPDEPLAPHAEPEAKAREVLVGRDELDLVAAGKDADRKAREEEEAKMSRLGRWRAQSSRHLGEAKAAAQTRCDRVLDAIERWLTDMETARNRRAFQQELRRGPILEGAMPEPSLLETLLGPSTATQQQWKGQRFEDDEVLLAFTRAQPVSLTQALLSGQWRQLLPRVLCYLSLAVLVGGAIFCLLAVIALAPTRTLAFAPSGAILSSGGFEFAAAARTAQRRALWDLPSLSFQELRQVEQVLFESRGLHALNVASCAKAEDGSVQLKSATSALRVAPDGRGFLQLPKAAEVFLEEMEQLRSLPGAGHALGAVLASEVLA